MKVLHVIPSLAASDGGPRQVVLNVCAQLGPAAGMDTEIATTALADELQHPAAASEEVRVWVFSRTAARVWKYSAGLARWLQAHVSDYDVVHAHAVFTYSTWAARRAAERVGVPLVISPHGTLSPYSLRRKWLRKWAYWQLVERRNLRAAAWLHATTPAEQEELRRLVPGQRVECVALGVEQAAWHAPRQPGEFRRRYGISEHCPLLLFLARLDPGKGLADVLLPAVAELNDVHLAVVGDAARGERSYLGEVRAVIERLGLASRVSLLGAIYGPERWAAYDDADLYVLPSQHENFGLSVIEAMARGVPCLVGPNVQSRVFVEQADAGRVVPLDPAALRAAIAELLAWPAAERQAMGCRGIQFVRRQLTWSQTARQLADLYRSVIRQR
jgi:glycosyltransferase involved in cell wall biosynthesis